MLKVENLTVRIHNFKLQDISFKVEAGKCLVILGPNGAGKTTLLETIAGLHKPIKGKIFIDGRDVTDLPPEKRDIGYLPQDLLLFPHLTVEENIAFGLKQVEKSDIKELMDKLNISHLFGKDVRSLSGGEKQKVCLARALIRKPKLLLLDEPLSALDVKTKEVVQKELKKIQLEAQTKYNIATIYVTHNPSEAYSMGDKIAVIEDGRLKQMGTKDEIIRNPKSRFIAKFMGLNVVDGSIIKGEDGTSYIEISGVRLTLTRDGIKDGKKMAVIRPDGITLVKDGTKHINSLEGEVIEILKSKHVANLMLDVGFVLRAEMDVHELGSVKVGDKITISIDPKSIHLVD